MNKKWHYSPVTGKIVECRASVGNCPYDEHLHFNNFDEAQYYADFINSRMVDDSLTIKTEMEETNLFTKEANEVYEEYSDFDVNKLQIFKAEVDDLITTTYEEKTRIDYEQDALENAAYYFLNDERPKGTVNINEKLIDPNAIRSLVPIVDKIINKIYQEELNEETNNDRYKRFFGMSIPDKEFFLKEVKNKNDYSTPRFEPYFHKINKRGKIIGEEPFKPLVERWKAADPIDKSIVAHLDMKSIIKRIKKYDFYNNMHFQKEELNYNKDLYYEMKELDDTIKKISSSHQNRIANETREEYYNRIKPLNNKINQLIGVSNALDNLIKNKN